MPQNARHTTTSARRPKLARAEERYVERRDAGYTTTPERDEATERAARPPTGEGGSYGSGGRSDASRAVGPHVVEDGSYGGVDDASSRLGGYVGGRAAGQSSADDASDHETLRGAPRASKTRRKDRE